MNVTEQTIRERCTAAVFERGQNYRNEGRIQRIERFREVITSSVRGSDLYDVTVDVDGSDVDPHRSRPCDGAGDCKHIVAVLLEVDDSPPTDESERVVAVLEDVSDDDLPEFVIDALARHPDLRDRFLARFTDTPTKAVDEYRAEIDQLFHPACRPTKKWPLSTSPKDVNYSSECKSSHTRSHDYMRSDE